MARLFVLGVLACFTGFVKAYPEPSFPAYFYPIEHRSGLTSFNEAVPVNNYEFEVIPNDPEQFALTTYDAVVSSLWDYIPNPITALKTVASKALTITKHVICKSLWVILGIALVIGFCAFTPFCNLTIERPFFHELRTITNNVPYLDEVEDFLSDAYVKYRDMQK